MRETILFINYSNDKMNDEKMSIQFDCRAGHIPVGVVVSVLSMLIANTSSRNIKYYKYEEKE